MARGGSGNVVPSIVAAEHIGPEATGDNVEAKRAAIYGYDGGNSVWRRASVTSEGKLETTATISGDVTVEGAAAYSDSGGTDRQGLVDADRHVQVDVLTSSLPSGAATSAKQDTGNTSLASIDGKITAVDTGAVVVSSSALPSGAATAAKQPALGTAGTSSADVITVQGRAGMTALVVDGSGVTQPVSISGVSTAAKQDTIIGHLDGVEGLLTDIEADTDTLAVVGGGVEATALRVTIANDSTGVLSVDDNGASLTVDNAGLTELAAAINSSKVDVNIVSSDIATGGTSAADDADFTAGTTPGTPSMGVYESTPTSVTDGDMGIVGITQGRRLKTSSIVESSALPTGASTSAKQDTIISHLDGVEGLLTTIDADTSNLSVVGGGTEAAAIRVTIANNSTGVLSVDDNGSSLTVDGTVGVSGTVTVDGSGVTQPVSNAGLTELAAAINSDKLDVNIKSSDVASGGTAAADDEDFTAGTTLGTPAMGVYESTPTSVTDGDLGTVGITQGRRLKTSATIDAALPAGTNNIGDVDVLSSALPSGASTSANQTTIIGHLDGVEGLLTTIDADTSNLSVVGGGTEAAAIRVTIANNSTGVLSVDDNGSSLTVDGTVGVSGTVTVDGSGVTQPVSNAGLTELAAAIGGTNPSQLDVYIKGSDVASGGTSTADDADFTAGTTSGTIAQGVYESTPTSVTDGDVGAVGITADRRLKTSATIDAALPAGTNAIGKLAANSGVDIGDVDVTSSALPTGASTSAKQDTIIGHLDGVEGLLTTIAGDTTDIEAAIEILDDAAVVLGTATYTEASSTGLAIGAVRRDADTTLVGTTNEWGPLQMDANGRLKVEVFSGETLPVSGTVTANLAAGTNNIGDVDVLSVVPGTAATNLGKAEDAAHASGDTGVAMWGVRNDLLAATFTNTDGDYSPIAVTSTGRVYGSVIVDSALPAGTNAIGKLAANSGVDIGDVDVTSAVSGTLDHGSNQDIDTAAEQITATSFACKFGVTLRADTANTGILYIGNSDVTVSGTAATDGIPLSPGDSLFLPVTNSNIPYAIASANNQKIFWIAV